MKIKTIDIVGKRWFQESFGNTYHTAKYSINGGDWVKLPETYGYDNQYIDTVGNHMKKQGVTPDDNVFLWRFCRNNKIKLNTTVYDVPRKKDLIL